MATVGTSDPAGRAAEFGTLRRPATPWLWPIFKAHLPAIKDRLRKLASGAFIDSLSRRVIANW